MPQPQALQHCPAYGASRTIGELIKGPLLAHQAECAGQGRGHLDVGHAKQRQATDHGDDGGQAQEPSICQIGGIHAQNAGAGKPAAQKSHQIHVQLDQRQVRLVDAASEQRPGEDPGAGAEFHDMAGARNDFRGDEARERRTGRRDRGHTQRGREPGTQEGGPIVDRHDRHLAGANEIPMTAAVRGAAVKAPN